MSDDVIRFSQVVKPGPRCNERAPIHANPPYRCELKNGHPGEHRTNNGLTGWTVPRLRFKDGARG